MGGFWANGWNITSFLFTLFSGTHLQVRPIDGYSCLIAQTTRTPAMVCLLGVSLILSPHFWSEIPKTPILGAWIGVFKQNGQILKVSYNRNYCVVFNQILHKARDHQVVIVGGPNTRPTNPRWRTAAILSPYICNRLTDFDDKLAWWRILAPYSGPTVKISNYWKTKMAAAAILKTIKIAISL